MEPSDTQLVQLLATDLHRHYHLVVERYQHRLYAFARRLTKGSPDAEDIVQEAFVSAYVSLENYPPQRVRSLKLQPWLYKITLYVFGHHTRRARLHLVPLDLSEEGPLLIIEDQGDVRPEVLFEQLEQHQELETLVSSLPESYRVALTCYYFEHLSYQEVADLLDQPLGTVKSTIFRGIRYLRTELYKREGKEYYLWNIRKPNAKKA